MRGYDAIHLAALLQAGRPAYGEPLPGGRAISVSAHTLGTSSFLIDGPRLQGGKRAINAIALWLALRNAASSAQMQSGKLAAGAFADGRTRKDRNSGYPG